jgi:tRNA modification GTPase
VSGTDTIAAIATAMGVGGVGIIRLSGPSAISIVEASINTLLEDRRVHVGWVRDLAGRRVDRVLAFGMRGPRSFTGEDVAELHGHGGVVNLNVLLGTVLERGARVAEPGEFTRRAVLNGKFDLARAEALLDVVQARSERALRIAQANLAGRLGDAVMSVERRLHDVIADIEARIDFPEDDLGVQNYGNLRSEISALVAACERLVDGFGFGRAATEGLTVALVGRVNVGKSSLLNALVGRERALVASGPGTTRDYLEVRDVWSGIPVTLVDTAGMRTTDDPVERRGIELGEKRVAAADVVVVMNDADGVWDDGERFGNRRLVIRSKADLGGGTSQDVLTTSAVTGVGLKDLRRQALIVGGVTECDGHEDAVITTTRQHRHVVAARDACTAAAGALASHKPGEVVALELRTAAEALAAIRGEELGERVLDAVFARFCIGK